MNHLVKIKSFYLSKLNNGQYLQFMIEVEKLINVATPEKLHLSESLFKNFQEKIKLLTQVVFENRSESQTKQLNKLDKEREDMLRYLLTNIRNERKSHIQRRKESAEILNEAIKNYKGITSMAYREVSVAIRALLDDLAKDSNAPHINTLGLSETLNHIGNLNRNFEELLGDRILSKSEKEVGKTKTVRKETDSVYEEIALISQSQNIINPSEESQKFVTVLNKLIDDTLSTIKSKK